MTKTYLHTLNPASRRIVSLEIRQYVNTALKTHVCEFLQSRTNEPVQAPTSGLPNIWPMRLMHALYECCNWQRLIKVCGALPDARRAKPRVCKLKLNAEAVVEYWQKKNCTWWRRNTTQK